MRISDWSSDVCSSDLAVSSAVEHCLHTARVTSSNLVPPTNKNNDLGHLHRVAFFVVPAPCQQSAKFAHFTVRADPGLMSPSGRIESRADSLFSTPPMPRLLVRDCPHTTRKTILEERRDGKKLGIKCRVRGGR